MPWPPVLGRQYVGGSAAGSTKRTYESGHRSYRTFRRLMKCMEFSESNDSDNHNAWVLVHLASLCCESERNLSKPISGKFAAVQ